MSVFFFKHHHASLRRGYFVLAWFLLLSVAAPGARGAEYSDDVRQFVDRVAGTPALQGQSVTVIVEADLDDSALAEIEAANGKLRYSADKRHELTLPGDRLAQLIARLPSTALVRFSYPHQALAVTGQGVALTGASDMQAIGNSGAGVKIGIIDMGFASLSNAQASGDLPASLSITDYTGTGNGGTDHGTNVAQIVYEMAPGASLYLAKINTDVQLQTAVNAMIAAGVRVINHSVGWYGAAFYDGTGPLCNIVNQADQNNIQWVNAIGNDRYKHYMATFTDANADLRHEFATGQNYNTISLTAGSAITLVLNWDAYSSTNVDYDLYLYSGNPDSGGTLVASSASRQGASYPYPYEAIDYTPVTSGTYYIVVKKYKSSTSTRRFALFSLGSDLGIKTTASSLSQPADCPYVLATGATNLSDTAESFSSEGPTTDGRAKPEVAAPNRVQTSLTSGFAGTSAAAPHAAGAVALLRAQYPGYTTLQIRSLLMSTSKDVGAAGFDYRTGSGRISLDADGDSFNHDTDNCPLVANSTQADMDGDGIGDACDGDIDGDGLTNAQEAALGTDPLKYDTDGDGLTDGAEVNTYGTNPLVVDTDGDGLTDGEEVNIYGTSPTVSNKGSLTADGAVNAADLMRLIRFVEGLEIPSTKDAKLGDMNSDNVLDIRDVLLLRRNLGYY